MHGWHGVSNCQIFLLLSFILVLGNLMRNILIVTFSPIYQQMRSWKSFQTYMLHIMPTIEWGWWWSLETWQYWAMKPLNGGESRCDGWTPSIQPLRSNLTPPMLDIASGKRKASETFRHIQKTSLILLFYIDDKKNHWRFECDCLRQGNVRNWKIKTIKTTKIPPHLVRF